MPLSRRWALVCAALLVTAWPGRAQSTAPRLLDDVEAAFGRIQVDGEHLTARTNGLIPKPRYRVSLRNWFGLLNHFQGVQRVPFSDYLIISGSNPRGGTADLFVARMTPGEQGEIVRRVEVDPSMWHAGGLSVMHTTLAVPLHQPSPRNAKIVFFDVSDPVAPRRLPVEIARPGRKAGAVALTDLPNGRVLVAVLSAFDGLPRRIDFYLSRTSALSDGFVSEPATWRVSEVQARQEQQRTFGYFQTINFIRQADGRLFLAGFHNNLTTPAILPGRDYGDLYEVVFPPGSMDGSPATPAVPDVIKIASRRLNCEDGYCNLDAAAGLFVDPASRSMSVYALPGWLDGDILKATIYRGR
ncbi:MAG TPA: hypothetical protein VMS54_02320 [Vicinamibacterales bacterium]|nr:hypothetical protein [Vicinamibacterales bacterium]